MVAVYHAEAFDSRSVIVPSAKLTQAEYKTVKTCCCGANLTASKMKSKYRIGIATLITFVPVSRCHFITY